MATTVLADMTGSSGNGTDPSFARAEQALRIDLAAAYRLAAHYGWEDQISTHFSVRLPGPDHHFLLNPYGTLFEEVTASSLVKVDLDGNIVGSDGRVNKAGFVIHSAIHANRPDANCIMHCHTISGIAVGVQEEGLLPLTGHSMVIYGDVGYHAYEGVVVDKSEQARLVSDLGPYHSLILRNHGTLTVGATIPLAFMRLYYLERACEMQTAATASGKKLIQLPSEIADHIGGQLDRDYTDMADLAWSAMLRMLDRRDMSYRD